MITTTPQGMPGKPPKGAIPIIINGKITGYYIRGVK